MNRIDVQEIIDRPNVPQSRIAVELPGIKSFNDKTLQITIKPKNVTVLLCDDEILTESILTSVSGVDHIPEDPLKVTNLNSHHPLYIPSDPTGFLEYYGYSENTTIGDLYFSISGLQALENRMSELEELMSVEYTEEIMSEYGDLQAAYANLRGYDKEAWAYEIITRLGLAEDGFLLDTPVGHASSGQKSKILLGMGIFASPTLLVLDNIFPHLDSSSKEWLINHLKNSQSAVLLAAYEDETAFLDKVADSTVIIEYGFGYQVDGNVTKVRKSLDERYVQEAQEMKIFRKDLERREEIIKERKNNPKFIRSKNAMQVVMNQYRRSLRDREELLSMTGHIREQAIGNPPKQHDFNVKRPSSHTVAKIISPKLMYGKKVGFQMPNLELDIKKGDRLAIVGPNGSGKSTLIKAIAQSIKNSDHTLASGEIRTGNEIDLGYFSPDELYEGTIRRDRRRVLDYVVAQDGIGESLRNRARGILSYWGFSKEEMEFLQVARLGKRAKTQLLLAILMIQEPNLLILDEPTADLPDDMIERLINSLVNYKGTIITISHEPNFLAAISPNKVLDLYEGKVNYTAES